MLGMRRACLLAIVVAAAGCASAQAMSRAYQINTADLSCDDANRYVQKALGEMNMRITDFRKARVGVDGYAKAERDDRTPMKGTVSIACEPSGVHIIPDQGGFSTGREFERGVFLSVTGAANLVVEREGRYSTGTLHKSRPTMAAQNTQAQTASDSPTAVPAEEGVQVRVELLEGFSTVLDFEANVAQAGILPVKISVRNGTSRTYDFDPHAVTMTKVEGEGRTEPMTARAAVDRLQARATASGDGGAKELGDVATASRLIPDREIKAARLTPGKSVEGYLYFPVGEYDRARVMMMDVGAGESEGFLVQF